MTRRNPDAFQCPNGMTLAEMRDAATDTGRHCTLCGQFKPWDDFHRNKRSFRGRTARCKQCWAKYVAEWNRLDHAKATRKRRIVRYKYGQAGLVIHDRIRAGDGCDICGRRTDRMAIDHCHKTDLVRGLLCKDCNLVLGWLNDDATWFRALADYLDRFA